MMTMENDMLARKIEVDKIYDGSLVARNGTGESQKFCNTRNWGNFKRKVTNTTCRSIFFKLLI